MQDPLSPAVAGAFPDAAHFVMSTQQLLASSITAELAPTLRSVLVYGAGLHAYDVLQKLIKAGVDSGAAHVENHLVLYVQLCQCLGRVLSILCPDPLSYHNLSCICCLCL